MVDEPIAPPPQSEIDAQVRTAAAALPVLPPAETLKTLGDFKAAASTLFNRWQFLNQAGITFDGKRDLYAILGYQRQLTNRDYRERYDRGGIAGAIVDIMPDATWRGTVEVREDKDARQDTEFEKAWKVLDKKHQIQAKLLRVDKLSRLSNYAVLFIGAPGDFSAELPRGNPDQLLYFQPYSGGSGRGVQRRSLAGGLEADCTIQDYETSTDNVRFGLPKTYQLRRTDIFAPELQRPIHWTRISHIAEGCLDDDVFGQPALERVWNLFDDLDKVTGGGSEAFWLRANAGMHLDVDKDMALAKSAPGEKTELEKLKDQAEDYAHQMTRMMRTRGVDIKQLSSDVANFTGPADTIIKQIAGAKRMPTRILTGSEMGELASSQDRDNWKDQVNGRQTQYAGPYILRPLIDRLIAYGYLPTPKGGADAYEVVWPHVQTLTEQEKADGATKWASVNASLKNAGMNPAFTDAEIRDKWYGMAATTPEQVAESMAAQAQAQAPVEPTVLEMLEALEATPVALSETLKALEAAIDANDATAVNRILGLTEAGT